MNIIIDNYKAGYEATSHMIEQGCRRIVHLGGNMLRNVYSERFRGYRQALTDNKIEYDPGLLILCDMSVQAGIEAAKKILKMKPRPDGLFTSNDTTAVTVMVELEAAGVKIPDDGRLSCKRDRRSGCYITYKQAEGHIEGRFQLYCPET
jgi:LacI family transcriptional regulator